jgi:hypothetical protein
VDECVLSGCLCYGSMAVVCLGIVFDSLVVMRIRMDSWI